jgi:hypothetical protein
MQTVDTDINKRICIECSYIGYRFELGNTYAFCMACKPPVIICMRCMRDHLAIHELAGEGDQVQIPPAWIGRAIT